jgi:hypothetical protein
MAVEILVAVVDEVVERLAADEDDVVGGDGALVRAGGDDAASIRSASVATAPTGYEIAA